MSNNMQVIVTVNIVTCICHSSDALADVTKLQ
jgi:hypothetical protein